MEPAAPPHQSLFALWLRFLRYGLLAWGGPVAQIGLLRRELVEEGRWVDGDRFQRVLGLYQALPGPEATELCVYFGQRARGRLGGILAGLGFLLPGVLLILGAAVLYERAGLGELGDHPALVLLQAGAAAIVVRAAVRIATHSIQDRATAAVASVAALATILGAAFWLPLVVGAAALEVVRAGGGRLGRAAPALAACIVLGGAVGAVTLAPDTAGELRGHVDAVRGNVDADQPARADRGGTRGAGAHGDLARARNIDLASTGLTAGSLTFGGAYTAIPFVHRDAVVEGRWIDEQTFLDSLAVGAVLPAPLVAFSTFVGYASGGLIGALLITVGMFLPAFAITLLGHRTLERLVDSPRLHPLLDGVAAAVAGIVLAVAALIGVVALTRSPGAAIFGVVATWVMFRFSRPIVIPSVLVSALIIGVISTLFIN